MLHQLKLTQRLKSQGRKISLLGRGALWLAVMSMLLLLGHRQDSFVSIWQTKLMDWIAIPLSPLISTISAGKQGLTNVRSFWGVYKENIKLKQQNYHLQEWKNIALYLLQENQSLKKKLNVVSSEGVHPLIMARVITYPTFDGTHTVIIDGGSMHGVEKNHPVVVQKNVVGRVLDVGKTSARILLTTDVNSRIPAIIEKTGQHIIVAGQNTSTLKIVHMSQDQEEVVKPIQGQTLKVLTSGKGGIFPPGLVLGTVIFKDLESAPVVVPSILSWEQLDFVQILEQASLNQPLIKDD